MIKAARLEKILISLRRIIFWISASAVIVLLIDYVLDVSKRRSRGADCAWSSIEKEENFLYVARYCHLTKDTALLRLYDADGDALLAERMYFESNHVKVNWIGNKLIYSNSESDFISLPPTFLDRLRAKLP